MVHRWPRRVFLLGALAAVGVWLGRACQPIDHEGAIVAISDIGRWDDPEQQVVVCALDGREPRRLAGREAFGAVTWRLDRLAVSALTRRVAVTEGGSLLHLIVPGDGRSTGAVMTGSFPGYADPAWSPDGRDLAVVADPSSGAGPQHLAVLALAGWTGAGRLPHARQLTDGDHHDEWPCYSPDGKGVVFIRDGNIAIADLATRGVRSVTWGDSIDSGWRSVEVSPDGQLIAASRPGTGRDDGGVWLLNCGGRRLRRLSTSVHRQLSWSPDGSALAVASGGAILVTRLDGSVAARLRGDGRLDLPCWWR